MDVDPAQHIRGFGANVNRFTFGCAADVVPIVYLCPTHNCETLAYFIAVHVETEGHVTCLRCLRPMERAMCTVH